MLSKSSSRVRLIASAAVCAALYAIVNAVTSFVGTPFGVGEFRPGVVIPAFFALVSGPWTAAIGAGLGSFIGDMISLVPTGRSTFILALAAGGTGNFVGFLLLGLLYEKLKNWKGFVVGTTSGLFVGNLIAAGVVALILSLSPAVMTGLLLFWFGTMFPFVIILVPPLIRLAKPYASSLSAGKPYPQIVEPKRTTVLGWSVLVAALIIGALIVALLAEAGFVKQNGGTLAWEALFVISAIAVIIVGLFLPQLSASNGKPEEKVPAASP